MTHGRAKPPLKIVGQGLAGTCVAWELWRRRIPFVIYDDPEGTPGSSRIAAGLINPVTGKNFEPTPDVANLLPDAVHFYQDIEAVLSQKFWHPMPIRRFANNEKEWLKILRKASRPDVAMWIAPANPKSPPARWIGAVVLQGGGRLDIAGFLNESREFFRSQSLYHSSHIPVDSTSPLILWCEGSAGLMHGRHGEHRCAKGEIITIHAPSWISGEIRIGGGGWLIPIGDQCFKVGATYEWDKLDHSPTRHGLEQLHLIAKELGGDNRYDLLKHEAAIRPIVNRSNPQMIRVASDSWSLNGLGSKGALTAPSMAKKFAQQILSVQQ
jgi:glycine/D-amino acid oxidase-like deaminating enzyme